MPAEGTLRDRSEPDYQLIETLRYEPEKGLVRGALHLARLAASASSLGFAFDHAKAERALSEAVKGSGVQRIRLLLYRSGELAVTAQPFSPLPADAAWRLGLAATRLDADDPLLAHKTTRRGLYDCARAEFTAAEADEVLLLNQRGELCEGCITNLFVRFGDEMLTPDLRCGLLPGILRSVLIENGTAVPAVLKLSDLAAADQILVGNSLRGLIPARMRS